MATDSHPFISMSQTHKTSTPIYQLSSKSSPADYFAREYDRPFSSSFGRVEWTGRVIAGPWPIYRSWNLLRTILLPTNASRGRLVLSTSRMGGWLRDSSVIVTNSMSDTGIESDSVEHERFKSDGTPDEDVSLLV
jgi:hypothetical protein